jgi:hypothetical protein
MRATHDRPPEVFEEAVHLVDAGPVKNDGQANRQQRSQNLLGVFQVHPDQCLFSRLKGFHGRLSSPIQASSPMRRPLLSKGAGIA